MSKKELFDCSLKLLHETEKAYLVTEGLLDANEKLKTFWLPKSQVEVDAPEQGKVCVFTVPQWLIEEKGITIDE